MSFLARRLSTKNYNRYVAVHNWLVDYGWVSQIAIVLYFGYLFFCWVAAEDKRREAERIASLKTGQYYLDACMKEASEMGLVKGNEIMAHFNCVGIAMNACRINGCKEDGKQ